MKKGHNLNLPYKKRTILSLKKITILFSFRHGDNEYKHFPLRALVLFDTVLQKLVLFVPSHHAFRVVTIM